MISVRIRIIRKQEGMTQAEFAEKLGTSRANIAGYEAGTREPSGAVKTLICEIFQVSKDWLENGEGEMYHKKTRHQAVSEFTEKYFNGPNDLCTHVVEVLSLFSPDTWAELDRIIRAVEHPAEYEQKAVPAVSYPFASLDSEYGRRAASASASVSKKPEHPRHERRSY